MRLARRSLLALGATLLLAVPALGADITVTTTTDGLAADGQCTLREAITAARLGTPYLGCASGSAGLDTVVLGSGTYTLSLPGYEDANASGDLDTGPGHELRILGAGPAATAIDAAGVDRVLDVPATTVLSLEGLTVRGGRAQPAGFGGGVRNAGKLVVQRVTFTDNRAGLAMPVPPGATGETGPGGGAISMSGTTAELVVTDSTFDANRAGDGGQGGPSMTAPGAGGRGSDGGAILVLSGTATILSSTFIANLAGNGGAGGSGNLPAPGGQGGNGGAIATFGGTTAIVNATFSANRAGDPGPGNGSAGGGTGGAIAGGLGPTAVTSVAHSTFAGNLRGSGSTGGNSVSGVQQLVGSLLADAAPVCSFTAVPRPTLVPVGDTSCGPGAVPGDANLGPLADNGGPTRTMLPAEGSAAIDLTPLCTIAFPSGDVDQRGVARIQRNGCDAGAVEVAPKPPPTPSPGPGPTPAPTPATPPTGTTGVVLGGLRLTPAAFRTGRGTGITFRLTGRARVVFTVRRTVAGRRLGTRCVAAARASRAAARCRRTVTLSGNISRTLPAGAGRIRFSGRLDGVTLRPGAYLLAARVVGGATTLRAFRVTAP